MENLFWGPQGFCKFYPNLRTGLIYENHKFLIVIGERKLVTFGTIFDMGVISVMSISGQNSHMTIMIHICVVSFKNSNYYS
jgi:hypothetical protein